MSVFDVDKTYGRKIWDKSINEGKKGNKKGAVGTFFACLCGFYCYLLILYRTHRCLFLEVNNERRIKFIKCLFCLYQFILIKF